MNKKSKTSLFGRAALVALATSAMAFAQQPAATPATAAPAVSANAASAYAEMDDASAATAAPAAPAAASAPAANQAQAYAEMEPAPAAAPAEPAPVEAAPAPEAAPASAPAATVPAEGGEAQAASIFVQDPAIFHQRQADLEKLKGSLENVNEGLDALLADASHIAKMNDQCSAVSINDVMGDECWTFYQVELPAFEEKYMQVTGEVRLGHMETARGLEDRKLQINACVDALYSFAASKDQFLNLKGGVYLEPLAKGFEAHYDFTLQYEPNHRKHAFEIAQKWGETCREMVTRQDGEGFAPYFIERLEKLNKELAANKSLAVYKVDTTAAPTVYMDISKPVRSAYYLNGVKLFHSRIGAGPAEESNIRIKFEKGAAVVEGADVVVQHGKPQQFKGAVQFAEKAATMNGRWVWENKGNTEGVDFGPIYDADSLAVAQAEQAAAAQKAAEEKAAEESKAIENRRGAHFSPWIAVSGAFAPFTDKSVIGFEDVEKNDLMIIADGAAAARVRLNFGETGDGYVAVGAGGYIGAGIKGGLQRLYAAPLAQLELGYKAFGVRETAVIAIPEDDSKEWMQFRSGLFYKFGYFGVELGHDMITNLGQGGYVSVFFEM